MSYARPDAVLAGRMVAALEACGWRVFWDKKIRTGKRWRKELQERIDASPAVLVLWSGASVASDQVCAEAESARLRGSYFPVRIAEAEIPQNLGEYEYLDLFSWDGTPESSNFPRLREDLDAFLHERAASRDAVPRAQTLHGGPAQPPPDDLRSTIDRALAKTVNRGEQISAVEALLDMENGQQLCDRFCFFVEGCVTDWAQALADHLRLRHLPRWPDAAAGDSTAWEATPIRLMGYGRDAFEHALFDKILRGGACDVRALQARIDSGELQIVFTELNPEERPRALIDVVGGALDLLEKLSPFAPGRRLIVLFGCSWLRERPPRLRRWLLKHRMRTLEELGCRPLERLGPIHLIHLGNWVNGFTEELRRRYDCDRLRDRVGSICPPDTKLAYRELKPELELALRESRFAKPV